MAAADDARSPAGRAGTHARANKPSILDRSASQVRLGWGAILAVVVVLCAIGLRFFQLDTYGLGAREAAWAFQGWSLFHGDRFPTGQSLSDISPLIILLNAIGYFLFGVTDAIARLMPAVTGLGLLALVFGLRPFLTREGFIATLLLVAFSPTLVFASRTVDPAITIAFSSLLIIVAVLRAGLTDIPSRRHFWAGMLGLGVGLTIAGGPAGISVLIALTLALAVSALTDTSMSDDEHVPAVPGAIRRGLSAIMAAPTGIPLALLTTIVTVLVLFTRFFSDLLAITGLVSTVRIWAETMVTQTSLTPIPFFFWAILLYELLMVIFAIVALSSSPIARDDDDRSARFGPSLFTTWFVASLVLFSFASGRQPEHASLVVLPLVLLAGIGLGRVFERINWTQVFSGRAGLIPLILFGIVIGVIAIAVLSSRAIDGPVGGSTFLAQLLPILFVAVIVIAPLIYLLSGEMRSSAGAQRLGWNLLLVTFVLIGMLTIRNTTALAFDRADGGRELLAQNVPTTGLTALVSQTERLSRDVSVTDVSAIDNTGSYGISIAIGRDVQWPYLWYFRDFPNAYVATSPAAWEGADMVISDAPDSLSDAGFVVQNRAALNRTPASYESMSGGEILRHIVIPANWYDGLRYVVFRELPEDTPPLQTSVGYTFQLANQLAPDSGPFDILSGQSLGPGSALGQFNTPVGIGLSPDDQVIYVVDSGNLRVQRFDQAGSFIGVWDSQSEAALSLATAFDQGPTGLTVGPDDGLLYVADTWNHRVLVMDDSGNFVREFGQRGQMMDTDDSPDPNVDTGLFFGPRDVAIADEEIYVTDTGNERVQVFAWDGTFLRSFGGAGTEPGLLVEPVGIAIGPDDQVYVADSGNARISVFSRDGEFVEVIDVPSWDGQAEQNNYLALDEQGVLYMTNPSEGVVEALTADGIVTVAGGDVSTTVFSPLGITTVDDGSLLVTDLSAATVVEVTPDSSLTPRTAAPEDVDATPALVATPVATPAEDATPIPD